MNPCRTSLATIVLTAICASSASGSDVASGLGEQDQIVLRTSSWGRPILSWGVNEDGSGWVTSTQQGATFPEYVLITRRWGAIQGRYRQVKRALKAAEGYAGKGLPCRMTLTDGPYGDVAWRVNGVQKTLPVQYGCMSRTADRIYERLDRTSADVQAWAADAPAEYVSRR